MLVNGLGGLTSFMASRGIEDMGEGIGEFFHHAKEFHKTSGHDLDAYITRKVKAKARKYNTIDNNQKNLLAASRQLAEATAAYRREKDGDDGDA